MGKLFTMTSNDRPCAQCGQSFEDSDDTGLCYECHQQSLFASLGPATQREIDEHIYAQRILAGMRAIRQRLRELGQPTTLGAGTLLYSWRYRQLKQLTPERLPKSDEQYWDGFYS